MKPTLQNYEQFLAGLAAVQFSRWPVTAEIQNEILPCPFGGGQLNISHVLLQYFGFPCQYNFTNDPYSFTDNRRHIILATDVIFKQDHLKNDPRLFLQGRF
jgi:hypothetical protein